MLFSMHLVIVATDFYAFGILGMVPQAAVIPLCSRDLPCAGSLASFLSCIQHTVTGIRCVLQAEKQLNLCLRDQREAEADFVIAVLTEVGPGAPLVIHARPQCTL